MYAYTNTSTTRDRCDSRQHQELLQESHVQNKHSAHETADTDSDSNQKSDARQEGGTRMHFAEYPSQDAYISKGTSSAQKNGISEGGHAVLGKVMASGYAGRLGNWMFRYVVCVCVCVCVCVVRSYVLVHACAGLSTYACECACMLVHLAPAHPAPPFVGVYIHA